MREQFKGRNKSRKDGIPYSLNFLRCYYRCFNQVVHLRSEIAWDPTTITLCHESDNCITPEKDEWIYPSLYCHNKNYKAHINLLHDYYVVLLVHVRTCHAVWRLRALIWLLETFGWVREGGGGGGEISSCPSSPNKPLYFKEFMG